MKILHVDNEPEFRDLVSFFLRREGDFDVEAVESAESALERLRSQPYDAVIVDYSLPGMDGIELLKIIRAQGSRIPFILFTGRGREDTAVQALNHGADFYLEKGPNPQAHFVELAKMLSQSVHSRRMDEDIARSEKFLSDVFFSIQDGVSVLDKDLTILRVNGTMERWYAHKMPLVGKKCFDAYHGRQVHCEVCPSLRALESGKSSHEEVPKIGAKGERVGWLEVFSFPMREGGTGELSGVMEYVRDITDRKKVELELRSTLQKYKELQAIIDKSPAILIIWAPEPGSPVTYVSDSIAQFGYSREDFVSSFVYDDVIHKDDLGRNRKEFRDYVAMGSNDFIQEYRIVTKAGETRWVEDHTYVMRDAGGKPIRFEGIVIDITPRKLAQKKTEELSSRLQAIVDAFPDLYFRVATDGTILDFNAARLADLYVPPQAFLNRKMQEVMPSDVGLIFEDAMKEVFASGKIASREYSLDMHGETRIFEARLVPILQESVLIVVRNITLRRQTEEALLESESRYRQLSNSISDVFFALDKDMRYTYWNKASEELTGISAANAMGKSISELFPGKQAEKARQAYLEVVRTKKPKSFTNEQTLRGKDFIFDITAHPSGGGVSVIAKDVTERRRSDQALEERDLQFKKLSYHVPGMLYQFMRRADGTYCVPFTSDAIKDIFGCSPEDVRDDFSPIAKVILQEDIGRVVESIEQSAKNLTPWKCEYRVHVPGRTVRWLFGHSTPEKMQDGSIVWHGYNTDITERKQAEDMLKAGEEKYRQLVELAQEGIILTDKDSNIQVANPRVASMIGYSIEEMTGRPVFQFLEESDATLARSKIEARKRGISERYETTFIKKDGSPLRANVGVTPVMDKDGQYTGVLAVITDLTDRFRYEEALEAANRKLNLLGQVTRHDALNQLAVLMGWLQIAEESATEKGMQEYLRNMKAAAETIRRQLDFTGDYQKMGVSKPRWMNLKEAFASGVVGRTLNEIELSAELGGVMVLADPMFEKVFHNLLENSMRHGQRVSRIKVSFSEREDGLVITYEDNGIGIPDEEKTRLFERGHGRHTGFGLFMVREILSITGMSIREVGTYEKGARFEIVVPAGGYRIEPLNPPAFSACL